MQKTRSQLIEALRDAYFVAVKDVGVKSFTLGEIMQLASALTMVIDDRTPEQKITEVRH